MVDQIDAPRILLIKVSEACNAGCFMCNFAFSKDEYFFSTCSAEQIISYVKSTGIKIVRLTGGEPLLISDIGDTIRTFKDCSLLVSVITNGYHLPTKADVLAQNGVDQVIISIDGANSETHDKYRRTSGLYSNCVFGISKIKSKYPDMNIRVNTVVGPHNLMQLGDIYDNLITWGVHQWSIIPIKFNKNNNKRMNFDSVMESVRDLHKRVVQNPGPLRFLGYSFNWPGSSMEEAKDFWNQGRAVTPKQQCHLVDIVRFYDPKTGIVYPCNCVPHRSAGASLGEQWSHNALTPEGLSSSRAWLKQFGPKHCFGCEPINAALGDRSTNLDVDPFGF